MDQEYIPRGPQPERKDPPYWRIWPSAFVIILGLAVSVGTWVHTYRNLNASIQLVGDEIIVQNNDDYAWLDPYVLLNTDYLFNTSTILPHQKFEAQLNGFMKNNTTPFPSTDHPTDIYIYSRISQYQWSCWFYKF